MSPYLVTDTYKLLEVVREVKPAATYLVDMFFPRIMPTSYSTFVSIEYTKQGRRLAPYVVRGAKGVNMQREGSIVRSYRAPLVAPRRTISLQDIETRMIGEQPVFSDVTPSTRAAQMQLQDFDDLIRMIQNRKAKMAAEILQTGQAVIKGYADDGTTLTEDTISFDWNGLIEPATPWDDEEATIYDDIKAASEKIQEESGTIPTLMVCGGNVERYLLQNEEIFKWLSIPNSQNLTMMGFAPKYIAPQARFIGTISALNLEVYSYNETYFDEETQKVKPYLDPDTVIIANPKRGKQLSGAVTFLNQSGQWETIAANNVPVYTFDVSAQVSSLTMFSRFLTLPETPDDWVCLKVVGDEP